MRYTANNNAKTAPFAWFLALMLSCSLQNAEAAVNRDYCITPSFIGSSIAPNLLLMLDNSASMYDFQYVDQGKTTWTCSVAKTKTCTINADCLAGEGTCSNPPRDPYYCYDQTYKSTNTYAGYFDKDKLYQYDATNRDFYETGTFSPGCAATLKQITNPSNTLYVCYTATDVTTFVAKGNYLNWLTASKFDEQKQILTGGKYVSKVCSNAADTSCVLDSECPSGGSCSVDPPDFLQAESRGCVGKGFIKEPLDADYVEGGTNTPLGITFSVKGPVDSTNPTAPSPGGQTSIEIFVGNYNETICQNAVDVLSDPASTNAEIKKAVDDCLSSTTAAGAYCNLYPSLTCTKDSNCVFSSGSCLVNNDGVCNVVPGGLCGVKTAGVCTAYNSPTCSCTGSKCTKICGNAGPNNGKTCNNAGQCTTMGCTAGNPALINTACTTHASCDEKWCTLGRVGDACSTNANCDPSACIGGPKAGLVCANSAACNSSKCVAPSHASKIGSLCGTNTECNANLGPCISGTATTVSKTKVVFNQSMQACWAYRKGTDIGNDEVNTVHNQCEDLYDENNICLGGDNDGLICTSDANCPGGGYCENGPIAIQPGNPAYLCSRNYTGFCATTTNDWVNTTWIANGYSSADECIMQKHREFCNAMDAPQVVDPTDAPSETTNYDNLPAIISDIGVEAQLGQPLKSLKVRVRQDAPPENLIQEFKDLIRMGAMAFNFNGTVTPECSTANLLSAGTLPCPKVCSTDDTKTCGSSFDCPSPATATCAFATNNLDGSKILHYVGYGHCNLVPATECATDAHCTTPGDSCDSAGVGSHSSGLIHTIDSIKGATWTPFAEGFYNAVGYFAEVSSGESNTNLRINDADYDEDLNPSQTECQNNNILLISDGMSTADLNSDVATFAALYTSGTPTFYGPQTGSGTACASGILPYSGSVNLDNIAWAAKNRKISALVSNATITDIPEKPNESISSYVVLSGADNGLDGECSSKTMLENTAMNGGTALYAAESPALLEKALRDAFLKIAAKAASGTAASVLASGEGRGSNLIQASFYPSRKFGSDVIEWIGGLQNLWYYMDPGFAQTNLREDTGQDRVLNTKQDYIMKFKFDPTDQVTKADLFVDDTGYGFPLSRPTPSVILFEDVKNIWDAGKLLWKRDISASANPRTIYTSITGTTLLPFTTGNAAALASYMTTSDAANVISYLTGSDITMDLNNDGINDYRKRTVTIEGETHVWKLGDILNSTPKIASWLPLNPYGSDTPGSFSNPVSGKCVYCDSTYDNMIAGLPAYVKRPVYQQRGVVFVGSNDGMMHAFKFGKLEVKWNLQGKFEKARLLNPDTGDPCDAGDLSPCGEELWAFIPKNVLPYLKYIPAPDYCHIYTVDLAPVLVDASIGTTGCTETNYWDCKKQGSEKSWSTILIGGMRYGGGCRNKSTACTDASGDGNKDCVNTPADDLGYSSYFALDVTDPTTPKLLWEFSSPELGFATSGPAVLRISAKDPGNGSPISTLNGRWFVVFGSGPTGPVDSEYNQFLGRSDQNLKLFVLDLKTGVLLRTIDTGIEYAFAGSLYHSTHDINWLYAQGAYQDDAVYIPYTRRTTTAPYEWTKGGVLNLLTKDPDDTTTNEQESLDPATWVWRKIMKDDSDSDSVGPVTSSVQALDDIDNNKSWVYFGTGRYYYAQGSKRDDKDNPRAFYAIKHPCAYSVATKYMELDPECTDTMSLSDADLWDVTNINNVPTSASDIADMTGCYINLDAAGIYTYPGDVSREYGAERLLTDPNADPSSKAVYFTTFKPYADGCSLGGKTFIWVVDYATCGKAENLQGIVMVQLSTGSIEQVNLPIALTEAGGRKSGAMEGEPPRGEGMALISSPPPVKRILQIRER